MLNVVIKRSYLPTCVMGKMEIDGLPFYTIERPWLDNTPFKSCIPEGDYVCKKYTSKRFPDVWEIEDVPGRTHILLHQGNFVEDVVGCIAVGLSVSDDSFMVKDSRLAFDSLRKMLPETFTLQIESAEIDTWL
ncbi:hypothetical protein AB832_08225 [Flavobacteriaceae bacterium (ex Bugula neritina AB1)]|nr:hypothetical protein AB832_08225 [Flavobacteriaceae bacterium (ex Bugula neritina AB1)]